MQRVWTWSVNRCAQYRNSVVRGGALRVTLLDACPSSSWLRTGVGGAV